MPAAPTGYLLSPDAAADFERLRRNVAPPPPPVPGQPARPEVVPVRVTGDRGYGLWDGRVQKRKLRGVWQDAGPKAVRVVDAYDLGGDGYELGGALEVGTVYLCYATGPDSDGTPGYAAFVAADGGERLVAVFCYGGRLYNVFSGGRVVDTSGSSGGTDPGPAAGYYCPGAGLECAYWNGFGTPPSAGPYYATYAACKTASPCTGTGG